MMPVPQAQSFAPAPPAESFAPAPHSMQPTIGAAVCGEALQPGERVVYFLFISQGMYQGGFDGFPDVAVV